MPAKKNVLLIVVDQWRGLMLPKLGADYLVVGRPILNQPDKVRRLAVVRQITDEIDAASPKSGGKSSGKGGHSEPYSAQAAWCKDSEQ